MKPYIILITGASGVGKTTFALEFAKTMNIGSIISTDFLREVLRQHLPQSKQEILSRSSYLAGKGSGYEKLSQLEQKRRTISAFEAQCKLIMPSIEAVLKRASKEHIPIVLEGVHIVPGMLKRSKVWPELKSRIREYVIYIKDSQVHKARFEKRQSEAPERRASQYLNNFNEIRWIQDYLVSHARDRSTIIVENSKDFPMERYVRLEPRIIRQQKQR